jgi:tight adherence protein C
MDADGTLSLFGDGAATILVVVVFLAAAMLMFAAMRSIRAHQAVRRRAASLGPGRGDDDTAKVAPLLRLPAARKLVDYANKHYAAADSNDMKVLRNRLTLAGIYDPHAVAYFFIARTGLALGLAVLAMFIVPLFGVQSSTLFWLTVGGTGLVGYLAPSYYLDRRIAARRMEHQLGFPDFLDLLVVCADAGLAMEAALSRVEEELATSYPSLSANIHMAILEIRAGRTMTEALDHFGDRLGLEEARSFAALLQQSSELGASISTALRVYSDDMRHKRMSRAEEKAHSLPAKLTIPMMACIFPVIFVVILTPVIVRFVTGNW